MKLSEIGELSLLRMIRKRFMARSKDVIAGIGDDSAVVRVPGRDLLLTSDMMVEGVHFDSSFITPYQLGFKIVSVNVSDIYAMGGMPRFMLLDLAAGGDTDDRFIGAFFDGVQKAMEIYGVELLGGDLSSSLSVKTVAATLIGYSKRPVLRSGARPGDRIYVTGTLGDAGCGLDLLRRVKEQVPIGMEDRAVRRRACGPKMKTFLSESGLTWKTVEPLLRRHLLPEARVPREVSGLATSMIDVSDGLLIDLSRVCDESGVGARVDLKTLPISSNMKRTSRALGIDPFGLATSGGEDYELLFTASPKKKVAATCIGEITRSGRTVQGVDGRELPFTAEGYRHWL